MFRTKGAGDQKESAATTGLKRELKGFWGNYVFVVGLIMAIFHIYALAISPINHWSLYTIHITFAFLLLFPIYRAFPKSPQTRAAWYDIFMIFLAVAAASYLLINQTAMAYRVGSAPIPADLIFTGIVMFLLLEGTRRIYGMILPSIALFFLVYAHYGYLIPGTLGHRGYSWSKTISYMLSYEAIFSSPINASATMVFLFLVFGAFLNMSGAGPYFIDLAMSLTGAKRGGPAKVAVISSALFGTVSGNSVANVVSTGAFTIPLMKSVGYSSTFAAAVEATASSGGQIMPPILGSAAFIMAEIIGIPYGSIMIASIIPALLYFYTVFLIVDIEAAKNHLQGMPKDKLPSKQRVCKEIYMLLPLLVLVVVLTIIGASPIRAALFGILASIVVSVFKNHRLDIGLIIETLSAGAKSACSMICACGTAGIVIGVLNMTGAGVKFASVVVDFAEGNLFLALILTMIASLVLGMGLPTSASYIICAAVVAPALVEMGLAAIQAHMFVFYFACISAITPPVAMAAYAGASISGAKPMAVGFTACKLGICAFIVPYLFCFAPSLLCIGTVSEILLTIATALIGATMLAYGLQRYVGMLSVRINFPISLLFTGAALLLIMPGALTDVIGLGASAVLLLGVRYRQKKTAVVH